MQIQSFVNNDGEILIALPAETSSEPAGFETERTPKGDTRLTLFLKNREEIVLPALGGLVGEKLEFIDKISITTPEFAYENVGRSN